LVSLKSALPSWMKAPARLEATTKTREVPADSALTRADQRWTAWQARSSSAASLPATPPSTNFQTLFSGGQPAAAAYGPRDPTAVLRNTPTYAKEFVKKTFIGWYWVIFLFGRFLDLDLLYWMIIFFTALTVVSLTYGFLRAREAARAALGAKTKSLNSPPA